ncbi:MAG: sodium:solute symporter [Planctomycetota bacterium]
MLSPLDYFVIGSYLALVSAVGLWFGRGQKNTNDYFLGGRQIPFWAAGLSIIATETSALTFIGAPVQSLRGDWTYLQLALGSVLARFAVAGILIGAYYRANVVTVYGFLEQRFGPWSRNLASFLFFVGRSLGSGVRLYGAAIALVVVADLDFPLAIALIAVVAVLYTIGGGIRAVIWTDIVQGVLLVGGALVALWYLFSEGGFEFVEAYEKLREAKSSAGESKLRVLNFSLDPRESYTLWAGIIGSMFLTMATHGTDQDMIQRALTCKSEKDGRRSLWLSAVLALPVVTIFLAIGSMLWIHFGGDEGAASAAAGLAERAGESNPEKGFDYLFPFYVVDTLPAGIRGLIVAAIFAAAMSSLDSAITALAATGVTSLWKPYLAPGRNEAYYLKVSRWMSIFFGLLLSAVAFFVWLSQGSGGEREGFGVLMLGLKVLTWIFPPLLGVFLVGVLTKRGRDLGNVVALLGGISGLLFVEFWSSFFSSAPPFAWTWNSLLGCAFAFAVAAAFPADPRRPPLEH